MEFLVTMTTHVPPGTPEDTVAELEQREAAHFHDLAARGSLCRLWRPPGKSGEWRTLGLFAAEDADELDSVLGSMPPRMWRADEVLPLLLHPNDPKLAGTGPGQEFLINMMITIPAGTPSGVVDDTLNREAQHGHALASQGHLRRLWALAAQPPVRRALGLGNASDLGELSSIVQSLPLHAWMTTTSTELSAHPSDPATLQ